MIDDKGISILLKILIGLIIIIAVACIVLWIWCLKTYGDLPPDEVPSWVHWFMFNN